MGLYLPEQTIRDKTIHYLQNHVCVICGEECKYAQLRLETKEIVICLECLHKAYEQGATIFDTLTGRSL